MNKRLRIPGERLSLPQNRTSLEVQSSEADTTARQEEESHSFLSTLPPPNYSISRIPLSNVSTPPGGSDSLAGGNPEEDYTYSLTQQDWPGAIGALQRLPAEAVAQHIADVPFEYIGSLMAACQEQETRGQNMAIVRGPLMERRYQDALARAGEHPPALEAREIVEILNGFNDTDIAQRVGHLPPGFLGALQAAATSENLERVSLPLMNRLHHLNQRGQTRRASPAPGQASVSPERASLAAASVLGPPLVKTPLGPVSLPTGPVETPLGPVSPPIGPVETPLVPDPPPVWPEETPLVPDPPPVWPEEAPLVPDPPPVAEAEGLEIAEAEAAETTLTAGEDAALETALLLAPEEASIPVVGWIVLGATVLAVGGYLGYKYLLSPRGKPLRKLTAQEESQVSSRPEVQPAHLPGSNVDHPAEDPAIEEPLVTPGNLNYTPAIDPATGQPLYAPGSSPQSDETLEAAWWGSRKSKKQKRGANQPPETGGPDDGFPKRLLIGGITGQVNPGDTVLDSIELLNEVHMDAYDIAEYRFLWNDLDRERAKLSELSHKIKVGGFLHFSVVATTGAVSEENLHRLRVILEESSYETISLEVVGRIIQGHARVIPLSPTIGEPPPYRENPGSYLFKPADPANEEYQKLLDQANELDRLAAEPTERGRIEEMPTEPEIPAAQGLDNQNYGELLEIHDVEFDKALEGGFERGRLYNKILLRDPTPANRVNGRVLRELLLRLRPGGQLDIDLDVSQASQKMAEFDAWAIEQSLLSVIKLPPQNVQVKLVYPQEGSMVGARLKALITNRQ